MCVSAPKEKNFVHLLGLSDYLLIIINNLSDYLSPSSFLPPSLFLYFLFPLSLSLQYLSPQISLLFINVYFNQAHFFANLGPKYCCIGQKFHKIVWKNPKELFGQCNISSYISQSPPHSILAEFVNNFHKK